METEANTNRYILVFFLHVLKTTPDYEVSHDGVGKNEKSR